MKKLLFIAFLSFGLLGQAQTNYFTAYNFSVEPQNVAAVYNMVDAYYKTHKTEGVTVWLYENHFNDAGNNQTHSLVFSGSQAALGGMYDAGPNTDFDLFLTRINALIKEGTSSLSGSVLDTYAGGEGPFPYRQLYMLDVEDAARFAASFKNFNTSHNPTDRLVTMGALTMGLSPQGESHFVMVGFKDMTAALGGSRGLVPAGEQAAWDKAWAAHMEAIGGMRMVRNSLMIVLGEW